MRVQQVVTVEVRDEPSYVVIAQANYITKVNKISKENINYTWMKPLLNYLLKNKLLNFSFEQSIIISLMDTFMVYQIQNITFNTTHKKYIMKEINEGEGENHYRAQSLAHKTLCQVYIWHYIHYEAIQLVRKYDKCNRFANVIHEPLYKLVTIFAQQPFYKQGMDIGSMLPLIKKHMSLSELHLITHPMSRISSHTPYPAK